MSAPLDGGPAFPTGVKEEVDGQPVWQYSTGMTLRAYLAAHAPIELADTVKTLQIMGVDVRSFHDLLEANARHRVMHADYLIAALASATTAPAANEGAQPS